MVSIELPAGYGYVLLSSVSTFAVSIWLSMRVGAFRKRASVPYPFEYASASEIAAASPSAARAKTLFNCAQRAHQNFNENHPTALGALLIGGLRFPLLSAGLGAFWAVNRVAYAVGYTSGKEGGKGRYVGIGWLLAHYVLVGVAGKSAWDLAML
ncbi:hypothetical protein BDV95DRAFT_632726 [Massariosphaeria phaeospora]|uniref:Membrane-associated proteins in eicosanoid and glutathione metabolism n=1 Tax=Massariosphaeria phaeospora TaxID=100035 RepID=A0A7C8LZL7_9PLEO|nr:hypothetical protein BDV95DRAFT_632726 [Massariosphaeria phaeospora]